MQIKISHVADIHIPNEETTHDEYTHLFENFYKTIKKANDEIYFVVTVMKDDLFNTDSDE